MVVYYLLVGYVDEVVHVHDIVQHVLHVHTDESSMMLLWVVLYHILVVHEV